MRKKYRERFLDPEVSKKIEVLENAPDTKSRLERVRTSLKSKVTEPFYIGAIGVFISIVAFLFFNEYAIIPIFFHMAVLLEVYKEKQNRYRRFVCEAFFETGLNGNSSRHRGGLFRQNRFENSEQFGA